MKYTISLLSLLLAFTACGGSGNNEVEPKPEVQPTPEEPADTLSVDERPVWNLQKQDTYDNSMMVLIAGKDLPTETSDDDQLGAFVGETCRGTYEGINSVGGQPYVTLSVMGLSTDDGSTQVVLKYYSGTKRHLYTSDAFAFEVNGMLGSIDAGFVPVWHK